jgi:Zn-dependent peptidase ImmA (M78 family)/DNA-binding XRE family transcriptional regulator
MSKLGQRLRSAREALGLTQQMVEETTGIGASSLSEFESGKREPRLAQLRSLADCYRKPLNYFLSEEEPIQHLVLWRQKPDFPEVARLEAEFQLLVRHYHFLEVLTGEFSGPCLPFLEKLLRCCPENFTYETAERLASCIRNQLGFGNCPARELLDVVEEKLKVKVFHLEFEPTGSAACALSEEYGPAILLNAKNSRRRRNFDLAHELFHLLTWKSFRREKTGSFSPTDQEEKFANCFARNLLVPRDVLLRWRDPRRLQSEPSPIEIIFGARYFDVSIEALVWQMKWVFNLLEDHIERLIDQSKALEGILLKVESDTPPRRPRRFEELAIQALRNGLISVGRFAEFMGISRNEALKQYTVLLQNTAEETEFPCGISDS